ncbi:MAG: hemerythrin domain-containing protein [Bryobacterales bacterium]|nr:hemerythrin domain-containing protein [Bryobacterales bacterium]MBV9401837.1 hemerythrin domain-containing protein [Bryobacterales bacterium]
MKSDRATRDVGILLGGIAAGIVGSRLLPPLIAAAVGSGRARAGGDPFQVLIEDHRQIHSLLDQMVKCPTSSRLQRARLFLALKRKLAKHALAEEDVIYPRVRNDSASGNERKRLYDDHAEMKIFLYEIEGLLRSGEDWRDAVRLLRDLVERHVEEEEKTIFPELRRELAAPILPQVSGQISREQALIL